MYSVRKNSFLGSYSARFLIILTCFLSVGQSNAQTGDDALRFAQRMPGLTASSMGMGGVGISGVTDASAFFNNPAIALAKTPCGCLFLLTLVAASTTVHNSQ